MDYGRSINPHARIVAATNRNLQQEIAAGRFREDLYYRLNVIPVVLPPLRRRKEDIPLLVHAFARRFNDQMGTSVSFSPDALDALMQYAFPGNVRELLNVVERCIALASDRTIQRIDLPPHIVTSRQAKTTLSSLHEITAEAEKNHIVRIVQLTKGNRSKAAEILGVSRKTLWEKINAYQLDL